jgi:hypothetical protein
MIYKVVFQEEIMFKRIIIAMMLICISIAGYSTETRVNGMSGMSSNGFYVAPNLWTDVYYLNPAMAVDLKEMLIRVNTDAFIHPYYFKDDDFEDKHFEFILNGQGGFIRKMNKLFVGYDGQFAAGPTIYNDLNIGVNNPVYYAVLINTMHTMILATEINKVLNFGYLLNVRAAFNYFYSNDFIGVGTDKGMTPLDLQINQRFSLMLKLKGSELSFIFPLFLSYQMAFNAADYDSGIDDWTVVNNDVRGTNGIDIVWDKPLKGLTSLRLQTRQRFNIRNIFDTEKTEIPPANTFMLTFNAPQAAALSIIHNFSRVMFFYGGDLTFNPEFYYERPVNVFFNFDFGFLLTTFIGVEITMNDRINLRAGARTGILNIFYDFTRNTSTGADTHNFQIFFPINPNFQFGMDIKVSEVLTVQIANGFLISNTYVFYDKNTSDSNTVNFNVTLNIGFLFNPGKGK